MSTVRKFTIGLAPYIKMHRIRSIGGEVVDAVLALRLKALSENFFEEVLIQTDHNGYRLTGGKGANSLAFNDQSIAFTRDYFESNDSFDFDKVIEDFRAIWGAVNSVVRITDVRRIGIVAESKYTVPSKAPNIWMRNNFSPIFKSDKHAERFHLKFENRTFAADGLAPDPKKSDFINTIYQIYDGEMDNDHSMPGFMFASLDVQRYFTPVITGKNIVDEVLKLKKTFDDSLRKFDDQLKELGASDAKK
jgi:hypothetical protein